MNPHLSGDGGGGDDAVCVGLRSVVDGFLDAPVVVGELYLAEGDGIGGHGGQLVGGAGGGEEEGGEGDGGGEFVEEVDAGHGGLESGGI